MILVIDNYDSFVYNLVRYVERLGRTCFVRRNDKITEDEIEALNPEAIIISPGPCTPSEAGVTLDVISRFGSRTPIMGVCLGHQAIGEIYGGSTTRALKPVHGKSTLITHSGTGLFKNIPSPLQVGRYHSLVTSFENESATNLTISAESESGEVMAVHHNLYPVHGVQFHPESILTPDGSKIIENFLCITDAWNKQ